ncbi:MAG TPA: endo-1,4-beta-xylanase [Acidobacteriaceae bacterium]|nr:endo-1,4-beta-xylanase [Acidobacteriaceae bacterium]
MGSFTRRHFLQGTAAAAALSSLPGASLSSFAQQATAGQGFHAASVAPAAGSSADTLRGAGASRGILVGCAVRAELLRSNAPYAELVRRQAGLLVGESEFKFGPLRPTPTSFFFDDADTIAEFAHANGMQLRGHNFVWHRQLPVWFDAYMNRRTAEDVLVRHIEVVGGRYAGRMHSWDVVNEAIQISDGLPDGMRNSPWQKVLPGYIDIAFRTARRVDPKALLVYNDYAIEGEDEKSAAKREAVLALLRGMQARGVPLDAVGIQSHISAGPAHTYGPGLTKFMQDVQALGLKMLLTEMDVNDRELPPDVGARDAAVAEVYRSYLNTTLANPAVVALLTWGITDRFTWLNHEGNRKDTQPERCLPFDTDLQPKAAFTAELEALQKAPVR